MYALAEARQGDSLTERLRRYSANKVKISKEEKKLSKRLVKDFVVDEIISYCRKNSPLPLERLEYTGSMYEKLKSEAADEVDLMIVLATTTLDVTVVEQVGVVGYVKLKADVNSPFNKYADPEGYINAQKVRLTWFYSLLDKAKNAFEKKFPLRPYSLRVSSHGPAVQIDVLRNENDTKKSLLSVDLVPCFQIGPAYFVAKAYEGGTPVSLQDLPYLWRRSFSIMEKEKLKKMDKSDHGCRHELLRIVKSILKNEITFENLKSFHLKTAFMHYIEDTPNNWAGESSLGEHYLGFLGALQSYLEREELPHYHLQSLNLLEDIATKSLENMANRLKRIKAKDTKLQQTCKQIELSQKLRDSKGCAMTSSNDVEMRPQFISQQGELGSQFFPSSYDRKCMLELFWIMKTIMKRDGILYLLHLNDVCQAFRCYFNTARYWSDDQSLAEHFLGVMSTLHGLLMRGYLLVHVREENVFRVANRCACILSNEDERNKILEGKITWLWPWAQPDDSLTRKLREYSINHVNFNKANTDRTRRLVKDYIEDQIMVYCRQNSKLPILRVEYTGSVYEGVKTEVTDEVVVNVVLKTSKSWLWGQDVHAEEIHVPGYVRLKASRGSKLRKYADLESYMDPQSLRHFWLYRLVFQAVRDFRERSPGTPVNLDVYSIGSAVELDIIRKGTDEILLTADFVPCFQTEWCDFLVAKPYTWRRLVSSPELLWRESFSMKEKEMMQSMDRDDYGCKHELFRIVQTILHREPSPLGRLAGSYHLKTAFMHYINKQREKWDGKNDLAEHFLGFLDELQIFLKTGNLPHFWLHGVNMLEDMDQCLLEKMANRLKMILSSRTEMNRTLLAS